VHVCTPQDGNEDLGGAINTNLAGSADGRLKLSTKFCKFDGNQAANVRASAARTVNCA
jgi:hypothetical protein